MIYVVTGCSGFIGFHVAKNLLKKNYFVIGIDNLNKYYDIRLKLDRLNILQNISKKFLFKKIDISNFQNLEKIFKKLKNFKVIHLAAQAGVRYSLRHPKIYIRSNILGFWNLLELSKKYKASHFIFASSSSVYGYNNKYPYIETDKTDNPIQLYAATKKSNEIISYSYSSLYNMNITALRFFTVYGPYGRPDMAIYKFTKKILKDQKIDVYNKGNHYRDFTYVDDIAEGIIASTKLNKKRNNFEIYNIGNGKPIHLKKCIKILGKLLKKKIKIDYLPLQSGDMLKTYAGTKKFVTHYRYKCKTNLEEGLKKFVNWYIKYYEQKNKKKIS